MSRYQAISITLVAVLLFLIGQTHTAYSTSLPQESLQSTTQDLEGLMAKAQSNGSIRVIVGLDTSFVPEGELDSPQAVQNQRRSIEIAQANVVNSLHDTDATVTAQFEYIPYMGLEVDAAALGDLASQARVISIVEDVAEPATLASSIPLIGADDRWTAGNTGAGQTIAVLDTGVDKTHSFFTTGGNKVVSEACYSSTVASLNSQSVCPDGVSESTASGSGIDCAAAAAGFPDAISDCRHGTHVAGIAAGNNGGTNIGVARDANIIAIQVFSLFTSDSQCDTKSSCALTYRSDQIKGLERVYALRNTYNIASANMSLGGGQFSDNCDTDPRKAIIDTLRSANIATVIASANDGHRDSMGAPACISTAISVGATNDNDDVASFSNIASFISLLAPGVSIDSSVPGNAIANFQGTSMAAPHVAGAWALLKEQKPDATVAEILTLLQNTGISVDDQRVDGSVTGMRRINLTNATLAKTISVCPINGDFTTIQGAINAANSGDTITICAGTYRENLIVNKDLTFQGENQLTTIIDGQALKTTVTIAKDYVVTISDLTITNGLGNGSSNILFFPDGNGGGVFNQGTLTLNNITVSNNSTDTRGGGAGIWNGGTLTIDRSTIHSNNAIGAEVNRGGGGGGIANAGHLELTDTMITGNHADANFNTGSSDPFFYQGGGGGLLNIGTALLDKCTISNNTGSEDAGGILNVGTGTLRLENCTVSGNSALDGGGIGNIEGEMTLIHTTVYGNSGGGRGGGIDNLRGTLALFNSIVANSSSGDDCDGDLVISFGYNIDSDGTCNLNSSGDQPNTDPLLGPLSDNGGPTLSHKLLAGSPAINGVANSSCLVSVDQRGVTRPQPAGGLCDIGAFELEIAPTSQVIYVSSNSAGSVNGVSFNDEDILAYNQTTGEWSKYFDGSDLGLRRNDINAFTLLENGHILMSFNVAGNIPGFGAVDDSDIVKFIPTSIGESTAGSFERFLDGSDVGLASGAEDIDAIAMTPDGRLVISTRGSFQVPGLAEADEDLIVLNNATFGPDSAGDWALYVDGSDVGLTTSDEDITASWIDSQNNDIFLNTKGDFSVSGASGDESDIFACTPSSTGNTTTCTFSFFWDGSSVGFGGENIDGIAIGDGSLIANSADVGNGDADGDVEGAYPEEEDEHDRDGDEDEIDELNHNLFLPVIVH